MSSQSKTVSSNGQIIYQCHGCAAEGVKLWRGYNTFLSNQEFLCVECVCKQDKCVTKLTDSSLVNSCGRHKSEYGWTDQINGYVPCIPSAEGDEVWGYSAVPQDRVEWWHGLPLRGVGQ